MTSSEAVLLYLQSLDGAATAEHLVAVLGPGAGALATDMASNPASDLQSIAGPDGMPLFLAEDV